jgi:single-strand DNA-binding protein
MNTPAPGDFTISPRQYTDDEAWFGLRANPDGTVNVPITDHYQVLPDPAAPWHYTEPDTIQAEQHSTGKAVTMSGETTITIIGNLTNDPELRFTPSGSAVANFTVASTPRTFDRQANEWKDGETLFLRASVWREAAENVAESLTKGTRVIVSGRLKSRSYETKEGEKRTVIELEVDEIGPSLRYANAKVNRAQRSNLGGQGAGAGFGKQDAGSQPGQSFPQDDPWATPQATSSAAGWGNGPDSEPPF